MAQCLPLPEGTGKGRTLDGDSGQFLSRLWEMSQGDGPFCDLQVEFGDLTRQGASSLVLAAVSPFFEAMLTTEMREKTQHVVQLPTISQQTFKRALAFSLGRKVEVGEEEGEVEELLQAADMLQLWRLKDACGEVLARRLTLDTCLHTLRLFHKFSLHQPKTRAVWCALADLDEVHRTPGWISLSEEEVGEVISTPGPGTASMDTKAAAVLRWLQENQAETDISVRLLGLLSLEDLSYDFMLDTLLLHPCVLQCPSVLEAVKECIKAKAVAGTKRQPRTTSVMLALSPPEPVPVSYVFVFNNCSDELEICEWLRREQVWINRLQRRENLLSCVKVCSGQLILTVQLYQRWGPCYTFLHYSLKDNSIKSGEDASAEYWGSVCALGDAVYAVEGRDISRYSLSTKTEGKVGSLLVGVDGPGVGALGDLLVVVGGSGENNQNDLIQTFHTKTSRASVSVHRLPGDITKLKFVGRHRGRCCFLSSKGVLAGLVEEEGEVRVDFRLQLQDFEERTGHGVMIEGDTITVYGGFHSKVRWGSRGFETVKEAAGVVTYDFNGQMGRTPRVPLLPKARSACHIFPVF